MTASAKLFLIILGAACLAARALLIAAIVRA
jgi:hypothetical protein